MRTTWLVLAGLGLSWLGACGKASSGHQVGGETHWLRLCGETSDGGDACGPDLECVCGVCTDACDDDSACREFSSEARCSPPRQTQYASTCGAVVPERICVRPQILAPGSSGGYPIEGMRYDAARNCLEPTRFAGTLVTDGTSISCDDAVTYATRDGECWRFGSSCIPEGFSVLDLETIDSACPGSPECAEQSCGIEQIATVDGCLSCDDVRRRIEQTVTDFVQDAGYGICSNDLDCALPGWSDQCWAGCFEAVAAASVQDFAAELSDATSDYCSNPSQWQMTCGGVPDFDCLVATPVCRAGTCGYSFELPCADRPLDTCEDDGDCALARAFPFDADQQCFAGQSVEVGCIDPDLSCPPVTTSGLDAEGNCFLFGNCLPAGFERAPQEHACSLSAGSFCAP